MLTMLLALHARLVVAAALPLLVAPSDALPRVSTRPAAQALRYTFTNSSAEGRAGQEEVNLAGTATVFGEDVRVDVTTGGRELMIEPGDYVLVKQRLGTLTAVDADKRRYFEMPTAMLQFGLAGMTGAVESLLKLQVTGLETRGTVVGAGPKIAGYPTTLYRVSQRYTLSASGNGVTASEKFVTENDFYVADAVKDELIDPFMQVRYEAAEMIPDSTTGLGNVVRQVLLAQRKLFTGTPLKTVTHSTSVDDKGEETVSTATHQITSITRVAVSQSLFVVPDGYTRVENPLETLAAGMNPDSARKIIGAKLAKDVGDAAKDGAKQGLKDEVRRGARDAVSKKVRGIFRKP